VLASDSIPSELLCIAVVTEYSVAAVAAGEVVRLLSVRVASVSVSVTSEPGFSMPSSSDSLLTSCDNVWQSRRGSGDALPLR
jgi:hypothetical protein